ncbi:hypothetical protein PG984_007290 [Apiospora sp. TS-2023a]
MHPAAAWTIPAYMDLGWPQPHRSVYRKKAGEVADSHYPAWRSCDSAWPAANNVSRIPFSVRGGRLQFDMVNSTCQFSDHHFIVHLSLEDLPRDFTHAFYFYRFRMQNFRTAPSCSEPVDMMEKIRHSWLHSPVRTEEELIGMNVALELSFRDVAGDRDENEIVDQCAYVTLVNSTEFNYTDAGICNQPGGLPSTMGASVIPSISNAEWGVFMYHNDYNLARPKPWDGAEYNQLLDQSTQTPLWHGAEAADPS